MGMVRHQCPGIYNRLGLMSNLSHTQDEIISIYFVINNSALFYASDNNMM
jgi:hypothetical protein